MPVVPFSAPAAPRANAPKQIGVAEEPWVLMAAATMDTQGRLIEAEEEIPNGDE